MRVGIRVGTPICQLQMPDFKYVNAVKQTPSGITEIEEAIRNGSLFFYALYVYSLWNFKL